MILDWYWKELTDEGRIVDFELTDKGHRCLADPGLPFDTEDEALGAMADWERNCILPPGRTFILVRLR